VVLKWVITNSWNPKYRRSVTSHDTGIPSFKEAWFYTKRENLTQFSINFNGISLTAWSALYQDTRIEEEQGLGVFENRVLRKILGLKWEEARGRWTKWRKVQIVKICTFHQAFGWWNQGELYWRGRREMLIAFNGEIWRKETTLKSMSYVGE
jgi:hypothetical protein